MAAEFQRKEVTVNRYIQGSLHVGYAVGSTFWDKKRRHPSDSAFHSCSLLDPTWPTATGGARQGFSFSAAHSAMCKDSAWRLSHVMLPPWQSHRFLFPKSLLFKWVHCRFSLPSAEQVGNTPQMFPSAPLSLREPGDKMATLLKIKQQKQQYMSSASLRRGDSKQSGIGVSQELEKARSSLCFWRRGEKAKKPLSLPS